MHHKVHTLNSNSKALSGEILCCLCASIEQKDGEKDTKMYMALSLFNV